MNPGHLCFFLDDFQDAIKEAYSYLLVNLNITLPQLTMPRYSG